MKMQTKEEKEAYLQSLLAKLFVFSLENIKEGELILKDLKFLVTTDRFLEIKRYYYTSVRLMRREATRKKKGDCGETYNKS